MSFSAGLASWKLGFQLSPIIFTGGVAENIPGGMLPIIAITEALNFVGGLLSGADNIELDNFFANFQPMPGSTLVDNEIGTYPFANQSVAANAIIVKPLQLSMIMHCPARNELGYAAKLATMLTLKAVIDQHTSLGGTYTVITPSFFGTNGLLTSMRDVSQGDTKQVQTAYQMDFTFPLLTVQQAQSIQASFLAKITSGTQISGQTPSWSGLSNTVGQPNSLASVIPSGSSLVGTNTAPLIPVTQSPL